MIFLANLPRLHVALNQLDLLILTLTLQRGFADQGRNTSETRVFASLGNLATPAPCRIYAGMSSLKMRHNSPPKAFADSPGP